MSIRKFGTFEDSLANYVRRDAKRRLVDLRAKTAIGYCKLPHQDFIDLNSEVPIDVAAIFSCCLAAKAGSEKEFKRLGLLKGKALQEAVQKCPLLVTRSNCVPGALLYFEELRNTPAGARLYLRVAKELANHTEASPETEDSPETPSIPLPPEGMLFDEYPSEDNNDSTSEEL